MKIILDKNRIVKYLIILPLLKPGLFSEPYFSKVNTFYSIARVLVLVFLSYKAFVARKQIVLSKLAVIVIFYHLYELMVTIFVNPQGMAVWVGPASSIITVVLMFDYYRSDINELIECLANVFWMYFLLNELSVIVCIVASGSVSEGMAFFFPYVGNNRFFLGMDNRFLNYFFPGIMTNYIYEKRYKRTRFFRVKMIAIVGTATLTALNAIGGMTGMIALCIVLLFCSADSIIRFDVGALIWITIFISITMIVIGIINPIPMQNAIERFMSKGNNYMDRALMWKHIFISVSSKYPLSGIGVQSIKDMRRLMRFNMRYNHAHNLIMTLFMQGGIIGTILWWISIFVGTHELRLNNKNKLAMIIASCIVIELITNIMDSTNDAFFFVMVSIAYSIHVFLDATDKAEETSMITANNL